MAASDLVLSALLQARSDAANQPLPVERFNAGMQQALNTWIAGREAELRKREYESRYGTPQVGTAPVLTVGSAPQRRRILGVIPVGPQPELVRNPAATSGPGIDLSSVPAELLTGDTLTALNSGKPVYYTPASTNYKPASMGVEELKARQDLLPYVDPGNTIGFLTEPDRSKAFQGAKPKVKVGNQQYLPVTADMRKNAVDTYGYDVFGDIQAVPISVFNQTLSSAAAAERQDNRTPAGRRLEGDQYLSEFATKQLYKRLGITPDQMAKDPKTYPKRLTVRDARALTPQSGKVDILSILAGAGAGQGSTAGDAVSEGFGF